MPYIKQEERKEIDKAIDSFEIYSPGQLNYAITRMAMKYVKEQKSGRSISYSNINEIIGVLECAKLEFYRAIAAPYEEIKIQENGKVEI